MFYLVNSVIGACGGWLMGQLGKGSGYGDIVNIISGVVGGNLLPALLGGMLGTTVAAGTNNAGNIGSWIASAAGASILTSVIGMLNKKN